MHRLFVLVPLLGLLAACAAAPTEDPPSTPETDVVIDDAFDVGGRELHLVCSGVGEPTIVLEGGEGFAVADLDPIREALHDRYRVCGYDRANNGASDPASTPRTAEDASTDLAALLDAAGIEEPIVLVGHSAGGLLVQHFARSRPELVAGVVALNPVPLWDEWSVQAFPAMTEPERLDETAYFGGANGESMDYRTSTEQLRSHPVPAGVPFHIVISTVRQCGAPDDICVRTYDAYEAVSEAIAAEWGGTYEQADAEHEIHLDELDIVIAAIEGVIGG